jgi:alkylation response protein AidB-like acyl-CoA dehydrogenase
LAAARELARVALAALCVGIGRAALEAGTAYVTGAEGDLDRSQSVQWMLADMATETEAARLLTWYAASRTVMAELSEAAAMARLIAADSAVGASRRAVQLMGPAGNQAAAGVERLYRDAKAMEIHHGAAEAQRVAVARQLLPDLFEGGATG